MAKAQPVQEIIDQIVALARPKRVIVFGSAARGTNTSDSDLDVLVVVSDGTHRRNVAQMLYRSVKRHGVPVDFVIVTESDLVNHKDDFWTVICPALREGKVVYAS
jgi:predicted nucleotidyltransferase